MDGARAITVSIERDAEGHAVSVTDEGRGLPAGFDPAKAGLGMKVISALIRQLRGCLHLGSQEAGRARITVVLPVLDTVASD